MKDLASLMDEIHGDVFPKERRDLERFLKKHTNMSAVESKKFVNLAIKEEKQKDQKFLRDMKRIAAERRKREILQARRATRADVKKMMDEMEILSLM